MKEHSLFLQAGFMPKNTEYIQEAIKGGIKIIAFTDHMPIPGEFNKEEKMRMDMAEIDSYLDEIKFFREKLQV